MKTISCLRNIFRSLEFFIIDAHDFEIFFRLKRYCDLPIEIFLSLYYYLIENSIKNHLQYHNVVNF